MANDEGMSGDAGEGVRLARWLSINLEELIAELATCPSGEQGSSDFDIVIVGSGYGGSIAAAQLAGHIDKETGKPARICVLERGKEYLAGMFPSSEAQLPGHVRFNTSIDRSARGRLDGLFDLRMGPDVSALVANGLGGGSLINAGVMEEPTPEVLQSADWPENLRRPRALSSYFEAAAELLAPTTDGRFAQFTEEGAPLKFRALKNFAAGGFRAARLSLSVKGGPNAAGIKLEKCIRCGDCATGCNHHAKNSLDQNCLVNARRKGVRIVCGATVAKVAPDPERRGWNLEVVHTDAGLRRRIDPFMLKTRRVILAAGAFGSTEILKRSQSAGLTFSAQLGARFSTNGDLLAAAYAQKSSVNAVATETRPFAKRNIGPTITGLIDERRGAEGIVIEEFAIPGSLRRLFEESFTLAHTFVRLTRSDGAHVPGALAVDPCAVDRRSIRRTQVFGVMGHDGAKGELQLVNNGSGPSTDGAIAVSWKALHERGGARVFEQQVRTLEALAKSSRLGGTIIPNPVWKLLPDRLRSMIEMPYGPAMTVHPLGGCAMSDSADSGVVDEYGRVFTGNGRAVHDGLVVLDGSIVPRSLGINPSLTISALTLRALEFHTEQWLKPAQPAATGWHALPPRAGMQPVQFLPSRIAILERVTAPLILTIDHKAVRCVVEMTIAFDAARLRNLGRFMSRQLEVGSASRIRIFEEKIWTELWNAGASDRYLEDNALFTAPLTGQMRLLEREASTWIQRVLRSSWAWFVNRGMRDVWQRVGRGSNRARHPKHDWLTNIGTLLNFASHAGEVRLFEYDLTVGEFLTEGLRPERVTAARPYADAVVGKSIRTVKRLTYSRRCNPWRQLSEMAIERFPNLVRGKDSATHFVLEPKFFARHRKHLMQFVTQRDQATALFEMGSFLLSILRILLTIHIWSFRLPDAPDRKRELRRLPGVIPGLPPPETLPLTVATKADGTPVNILLTRYPRKDSRQRPVVLIHGFSANGTTFAHPALKPGLAQYLWDRGRDVWILDLRTSSGLSTARDVWTFEEVACVDIPSAFEFVRSQREREGLAARDGKIDVVTQCMGAAMLSMAILDDGVAVQGARTEEQREAFHASVGNVVLSQVSPMVVFTAANIFRAYAVSYVQQAAGTSRFELTPSRDPGGQLLDRLLGSVPYPDEDFEIENPPVPWKRTPWVGTRHRMDAWFGRTFNSSNIDSEVLESIDDMFGTINLHTTFQTIQFARRGSICKRDGRNVFISPDRLRRWQSIPTLSIHGADNGLSDVATVTRMHWLMRASEAKIYDAYIAPGFGHQDCMIGRRAPIDIFPRIAQFLDDPKAHSRESPTRLQSEQARAVDALMKRMSRRALTAAAPWLGPVIGAESLDRKLPLAVAADPKLGAPYGLIVAPVVEQRGRWSFSSLEWRLSVYPLLEPVPCEPEAAEGILWYSALIDLNWEANETVLLLLVYDQFQLLTLDACLTLKKQPRPTPADSPGFDFAASNDSSINEPLLELEGGERQWIVESIEDFLVDCSHSDLRAALFQRPRQHTSDSQGICFAVASCQYPPGPLDQDLAADSYRRLAALLEPLNTTRRPDFLVLGGDQVYVDPTAGLMDPALRDARFEVPYERFMQMDWVREVLKRVPTYMVANDHEIQHDWEPHDATDLQMLRHGRASYLKFQRVLEPPESAAVPGLDQPGEPRLWFTRSPRGLPFFFTDTRTERMSRDPVRMSEGRIMRGPQLRALLDWLSRNRKCGSPMFVVSPSILLPRRRSSAGSDAAALRSDAWDGYLHTFRTVLAHIANDGVRNVVFLSGDEHHSCVAQIALTPISADGIAGPTTQILSIHSSALYAPFPFANGRPEDLAGDEEFTFADVTPGSNRTIRCRVRTRFLGPAIGGFATVECTKKSNGVWNLTCVFDLKDRQPTPFSFDIQTGQV